MRVLFVCPCTIQDRCVSVASWILGIIHHLNSQINIEIISASIISASDKSKELRTFLNIYNKKVPVYLLSEKKFAMCFSSILQQNAYDAILLFGTESFFAETVIDVSTQLGMVAKTAVFLQGICTACAAHYYEGVPEQVAKCYTVRDFLRRDRIIDQQKEMEKKAAREKRILCKAQNIIGRTTLDRSVTYFYHSEAQYFKCNDVLRKGFYERFWSYEKCKKHSIFISQYYYPLKGFHFLLKAASLLLPKYPDLQIVAAGYNPIDRGLNFKELKDSSYIRYIKKLAKKYSLVDHIQLVGMQGENDMIEQYLKSNVYVLCSTIENSPNSLAEAMTLGVPTVASDVGGVSDYATHNVDAFLYPATEPYLLAHYIDALFDNMGQASSLGINARARGLKDYDSRENIGVLEEIIRKLAER